MAFNVAGIQQIFYINRRHSCRDEIFITTIITFFVRNIMSCHNRKIILTQHLQSPG